MPVLAPSIPDSMRQKTELVWARRLVWLYFWLLLLEGALRKWFFPQLANPLLIIRDPIVVLIYLLVASRNSFPANGFIVFSVVMSILLGLSAMFFGHGNLLITLYGLRTNFLHLPLIFIIPQLFSMGDVVRFGRTLLWVSLPMAVLIVLQFFSPSNSWLNYAVGGTAGQISGAMGHVRPAGTFSFATGTASFLALQTAFIIAFFIDQKDRLLRGLALVALIFALVCSISRGAIIASLVVALGAAWGLLLNPSRIQRGLILIVAAVGMIIAASFTPVWRSGSQVMNARFEDANMGGSSTVLNIAQRIWNDTTEPFRNLATVSLSGAGTGAGTNVAAGLIAGERKFILAELEWSRLILESGLVLGLFMIGLRVVLSGYVVYWAYRALTKDSNYLPWIICWAIFPLLLNGQWGQPTTLGFATLGAGLVLAATRPSYATHPLITHASSTLRR